MKKKCMAVGGTAKKPATMEEQLAGIRGKVRPGYQAGGIAGQVDDLMNRTKAMPNSIASAPQPYGGSVIPAQTGQQAMQSATNFGMPPAGTAPAATSQTISTGDYSTGPKETGFVFSDGTRRDGLTQDQAKQLESQQAMQRAQQSANATAPSAAAPLLSMAEKESALGLNPNRVYKPGSAMDPLASGGGIAQAMKTAGETGVFRKPAPDINQLAQFDVPMRRGRQRPDFANGGILDKLIRTVGKILPESNGQKYEPGIQSRASEDPARHGRAEALNPRTQTASSETPPAGGFQEEAERRRKQMEEAKNYEAGGLITPVNLGQGLYQAIAQPIAEDWRQGNAAIKKLRDQYPTADTLAGINPYVAAAQVANDVAAGNVGGDTAINVAQAVPVIKGLSGMAKMLTKQAGPTIGATKFVIDMPNTVRKNVALTTGQTLGQPANAFAAGGMVRFSGKGGRVLPDSNGQRYEPGIQSRAAEDPARHGRAEALNPRTQTAPSETPPSGGFQEESERRRKQMKEAMNYADGGRLASTRFDDGTEPARYGYRSDGSRKGSGFLGEVAGPNGTVSTEVSIGVPVNGRQTEIPSMVPSLVKQESDFLAAGGNPTRGIVDKAIRHAEKRIGSAKSPFYVDHEDSYESGGMVRFSGKGGPRDDKIPVKVAGQEINVSNGENAVILPAKTAANPAALYAIGGIIQATNDGRKPKMGMEKGGKYKDGAYPYDDKPPTAQEVYAGASPAGIVQAITPDSWRTARVVAPAGSVGGGMSSSGTDPRDIPAGGTITNLAPALQQIHNFAKPAYDLSPSMRALGTVGYAVGNVFADSAEANRKGTTYGDARAARIAAEGKANAAPYSNEGRPSALGQAYQSYKPKAQGIAAGVANDYGAVVNDGMTTTQMGAGFDPTKLQMAPGYGMASNAAGKTISVGPSEYIGADGKPTSRWTDTQQYKDAIARNEADKLRLAEMQSRRLGADPMAVQKASQGIAQSVMQSGLAAQQAGQAQQIQQFAIDRAAREQSLIDAWDKAETPEQKQAIAGQLKIMRGQQEKEGQFKDAVEEVVDEKTGQVIKRPVIYSANTGQQAQQGQSQAQQSFKTADEVETARKAGKVKSGDVVIINGRPARIN